MLNPEIQRYIWLELTPHRLIAMPIILMAIYAFFYVSNGNSIESFTIVSIWGYIILTLIWGSRLVTESIINEKIQNTWDWQRLSGASAWTLSIGKLFGSTIFVWYGAIFCLIMFFVGSAEYPPLIGTEPENLIKIIIIMILGGFFVQSLALLLSLQFVQHENKIVPRHATLLQVFLFVFVILLFNITPFMQDVSGAFHKIQWYDFSINPTNFIIYTLLAFLFWTLLGVHHLMRSELQFKNYPWLWLGFIGFICSYILGFLPLEELEAASNYIFQIQLFISFFIVLTMHYIMLLIETKNISQYQRLLLAIKESQLENFFIYFPRWGWSIVIIIIIYLLLFILPKPMLEHASIEELSPLKNINMIYNFLFIIILFAIRDILLFLWLSLNPLAKRVETIGIIYLFLLYFLLPNIVSEIDFLKYAFSPHLEATWLQSGIPVSIQIILLGYLVIKRWKRFASIE